MPNKLSIIYDSNCPFCIAQIARIRKWDKHNCFDYVSAHDPHLAERFPTLAATNISAIDLSPIDLSKGMRLVFPDGSVAIGADAVYGIASRLPATKLISALYKISFLKPIAKLIYKLIADNRQRLSGKTADSDKAQDIHVSNAGVSNAGVSNAGINNAGNGFNCLDSTCRQSEGTVPL